MKLYQIHTFSRINKLRCIQNLAIGSFRNRLTDNWCVQIKRTQANGDCSFKHIYVCVCVRMLHLD
jgi:hypothetical protein